VLQINIVIILKKIAVSKPVLDFAIVVHKSLDKNLSKKIKTLLFKLKDKKILRTRLKKGLQVFVKEKIVIMINLEEL